MPLERIQVLCGHDSVTTAEIYVKPHWRGVVERESHHAKRVVTRRILDNCLIFAEFGQKNAR
jgi:hypothetical protein